MSEDDEYEYAPCEDCRMPVGVTPDGIIVDVSRGEDPDEWIPEDIEHECDDRAAEYGWEK